ncbi:MAG: cupin domain-containing protein [Parvularculaceae bacterium]|nr:cupin domain-containing protein [Parvularculaceae bacterium]
MDAQAIIDKLGLKPHPEGGHYVETYRDEKTVDGRSVGTAIYFLLQKGERSRSHRVDAAEVWHYYAGAPLKLTIGGELMVLGPDLPGGERPQAVVPAGVWQAAESVGAWTLVGCTVAPGFEFSGFEMADDA